MEEDNDQYADFLKSSQIKSKNTLRLTKNFERQPIMGMKKENKKSTKEDYSGHLYVYFFGLEYQIEDIREKLNDLGVKYKDITLHQAVTTLEKKRYCMVQFDIEEEKDKLLKSKMVFDKEEMMISEHISLKKPLPIKDSILQTQRCIQDFKNNLGIEWKQLNMIPQMLLQKGGIQKYKENICNILENVSRYEIEVKESGSNREVIEVVEVKDQLIEIVHKFIPFLKEIGCFLSQLSHKLELYSMERGFLSQYEGVLEVLNTAFTSEEEREEILNQTELKSTVNLLKQIEESKTKCNSIIGSIEEQLNTGNKSIKIDGDLEIQVSECATIIWEVVFNLELAILI